MRGTFQQMIEGKGYCFIVGEDGQSYFAHAKSFVDQKEFMKAKSGDAANFIPTTGPKGLRAEEVKLCSR